MNYLDDRFLVPPSETTIDFYRKAKPFSHIEILDSIKVGYVSDLAIKFPKIDRSWWNYNNPLEKKYTLDQIERFPREFQELFFELFSPTFLNYLEALTGFQGLIPDTRLNGAGLHQSAPGGKLDIHADYNYHPHTGLKRVVNVLLYFNYAYKTDEYGHLELWDAKMQKCCKKIDPRLGTMVIFNSTDTSFHGHPTPLTLQPNQTRKSIACYYYQLDEEWKHINLKERHSTLYQPIPGKEDSPELKAMREQRARGRIQS